MSASKLFSNDQPAEAYIRPALAVQDLAALDLAGMVKARAAELYRDLSGTNTVMTKTAARQTFAMLRGLIDQLEPRIAD